MAATTRTWLKGPRPSKATSAAVAAAGDLVTGVDGSIAVGDGITPLSALPTALVGTDIAAEEGITDALVDTAGGLVQFSNDDGTTEIPGFRHQPASVPKAALRSDVTDLLVIPIALEEGYGQVNVDTDGGVIDGVLLDGTREGPSGGVADGAVTVAKLAPDVLARLQSPLPTQDLATSTGTAPNRRTFLDRDVPFIDRLAVEPGVDTFDPVVVHRPRGLLYTRSSDGLRRWLPAPHTTSYRAVPEAKVARYGDSLTAGKDLIDQGLESVIGAGTSINQGVPGQASTDIAMRQGGVVVSFTVAGGAIPASGPVAVTPVSSTSGVLKFATPADFTFGVTLAGVPGTLTHAAGSQPTTGWTFARTTSGAAVSVTGATPALCTSGPGAPSGHNQATCGAVDQERIQVLGLGRNNGQLGTYGDTPADIAACVTFLKAYAKRYIVLPIANRLDEIPGTAAYADIMATNAVTAAAAGAGFFDLRRYLVLYALENMGLTATSADLADRANDTIPRQLHGTLGDGSLDPLHWSDPTYFHVGVTLGNLMKTTGVPQMGAAGKGWF